MHDSNFHQLEELFIELCNAKIDYIENSQKNATSSENNNNTNNSNNSNGNNNNSQSKKVLVLQEFWYFVGQEVSQTIIRAYPYDVTHPVRIDD